MTLIDQVAFRSAPLRLPRLCPRVATAALSVTASLVSIVLIAADLKTTLGSVATVMPSLPIAFGLSHAQASVLAGAPEAMMGLVAVPAPWLASRFGRDRVILLGLAVLLIASVAHQLSGSVLSLLLSAVGISGGIVLAGTVIGGFTNISSPGRTILTGAFVAAPTLGAALWGRPRLA